jgi:hypothetical protein
MGCLVVYSRYPHAGRNGIVRGPQESWRRGLGVARFLQSRESLGDSGLLPTSVPFLGAG